MARRPGVRGVVGAVRRAAVVVDEAVVGALVAHDGDAGRLGRLDVGRRRPLVDGADDGHGRAGARRPCTASSGSMRAVALPVVGHLEHPVEADRPVEAPGAGGLEREHPAHAEPGDADRLDLEQVGGRHQVGEERPVVDRGHRRRAAPRAACPPAPATAPPPPPPSRCSSASRCACSSNSGRNPMMSGISTSPAGRAAEPSDGTGAPRPGVPDGSVACRCVTSTGRGCWTRRGG